MFPRYDIVADWSDTYAGKGCTSKFALIDQIAKLTFNKLIVKDPL